MGLTKHKNRFSAALVLLALALQSFVAGTHIHFPVAAQHQQQQHDNDPSDCGICKGLAAVGYAILPSAGLIGLILAVVPIIVAATEARVARNVLSHHWFSRGPPSA